MTVWLQWGGQFGSGLFADLLRFTAIGRFLPVPVGAFLPRCKRRAALLGCRVAVISAQLRAKACSNPLI
jgi:hypothetical protein